MHRKSIEIKPAASLKVFDEPHAADVILFIYTNPGCLKTDIYNNVARGTRMGDKLEILQQKGIITIENRGRFSALTLTEKGKSVAEHLQSISDLLAD